MGYASHALSFYPDTTFVLITEVFAKFFEFRIDNHVAIGLIAVLLIVVLVIIFGGEKFVKGTISVTIGRLHIPEASRSRLTCSAMACCWSL